MELRRKLEILADAAKYDVSCASSGSNRKRSAKGIGNTDGMGICHSFTPDGRCVSLLKLLLTNFCIYDCAYCINRKSSGIQRARFKPEEVVRLTLDFYRRNYIEGLFLSSGIIQSPDYTMEQLIRVAKTLREAHDFGGYIHLKAAPGASPELLHEAGRYADRLSANIELPVQTDLDRLAPEKTISAIEKTIEDIKIGIDAAKDSRRRDGSQPAFAPAGQSTQIIVGATDSSDGAILHKAESLYDVFGLRRVYYSAFSPIPDSDARLPLAATPLMREHRLYEADWLIRNYGFRAEEIAPTAQCSLDLDKDPKLAWALRNRHRFPLDVNRASAEELLRVPGLGARNVGRILKIRRHQKIRLEDLARLRVVLQKARWFITTADHNPAVFALDVKELYEKIKPQPKQLNLFDESNAGLTALNGEI